MAFKNKIETYFTTITTYISTLTSQSLIKHTSLAFVFIISSVVLTKILPNNLDFKTLYNKNNISSLGGFDIRKPNQQFGFALDTFQTERKIIESGETLLGILQNYSSGNNTSYELIRSISKKFNPRIIQPGKEMLVLKNKQNKNAEYLIYQPDVYKYIVFDFETPENTRVVYRPVDTLVEVASGVMEGSLWQTIKKYDMDTDLAEQMENAMECAFDLSRSSKGDHIKLVYEKKMIEGQEVGAGRLLAAYYKGRLGEKYVFNFQNKSYKGYFDEDGRPMRKSYLKAPLKYARISSGFSMSRLHPVLNKVIPHFGTDYAAPYGTPIIAVSDGIVTERGYTSGNGNHVKIKHDSRYATQYLHMSRFATGIRKGSRVRQGQTIGYVGSTGLATGPHVCFRFWKDGRQVNPKNLSLPAPNPIPGESLVQFKAVRNEMMRKLSSIGKPLPGQQVVKISAEELELYSGQP